MESWSSFEINIYKSIELLNVKLEKSVSNINQILNQARLYIADRVDSIIRDIDIETESILIQLNLKESHHSTGSLNEAMIKIEKNHLNEIREKMIFLLNQFQTDCLNNYDEIKSELLEYKNDFERLKNSFRVCSKEANDMINQKSNKSSLSGDLTKLESKLINLFDECEQILMELNVKVFLNKTVFYVKNLNEFENKMASTQQQQPENGQLIKPIKYPEDLGYLILIDDLYLTENELNLLNIMFIRQLNSLSEDWEDDIYAHSRQPSYRLFKDLDEYLTRYQIENSPEFRKNYLFVIEILKAFEMNKFEKIMHFNYDKLNAKLNSLEIFEIFLLKSVEIERDCFDSLNNLCYLTIIKSSIQRLKENQFLNLKHLIQLNLRENQISNLHPNTFNGLSKLKILNLCQNRLDSISMDHFKNLVNLEQLILSENELTMLSLDLFRFNENLEILHLNNNKLTQLSSKLFQNLINLEELDLSSNLITHLEAHCFAGLTNLQILNLSGNYLDRLVNCQFDQLKHLSVIYLQQNKITHIEANAFEGLANLQRLYLTFNLISRLNENQFKHLTSLEELYLSFNLIGRMDTNAFNELSKLKSLHLSDNQLEILNDNQFKSLVSLEKLYLTWNKISFINLNAFNNLNNLIEMDIRVNRLKTVNEREFKSFEALKNCSVLF